MQSNWIVLILINEIKDQDSCLRRNDYLIDIEFAGKEFKICTDMSALFFRFQKIQNIQ